MTTPTTAHATTLGTPDGPFTIITTDGAVVASGWTHDVASLLVLVHPTLRPDGVHEVAPGAAAGDRDLAEPVKAVAAYYAGDHHAAGRVPVRQRSGPYRELAWDVLRGVEPGETVTYAQYAARTGRPAAVRAAAGACATNAAALFVPCHRVLRTDGSLGGFRYGLTVKERLLAREADVT